MAKRIKKFDFSNVQAYKKCEEGSHRAKLIAIDEGTSQAGDDMLKATFEVIQGESKGARLFDNFTLTDKALWKFKLCLEAMGVKSSGKVAIDLDKLIGKLVIVEVGHEQYQGQVRARILDYSQIPTDEEEEDWDEEEDEEPKKKKEEPEDDEDWDEEEEVEEKPKKKPTVQEEEEVKPKKQKKEKPKKKPEPEEDDEDWEDE